MQTSTHWRAAANFFYSFLDHRTLPQKRMDTQAPLKTILYA